jgi:hypothetical protein
MPPTSFVSRPNCRHPVMHFKFSECICDFVTKSEQEKPPPMAVRQTFHRFVRGWAADRIGSETEFRCELQKEKTARFRLHAEAMIYKTINSDQLSETLRLDTANSQGCDSRENFVNKFDFVNILDARRFQ